MRFHKSMAFVPILLIALAGCATTSHGNLVRSAERLERNADTLARDDRGGRDLSGASYSREADQLAEEAHDFRRTLADRDADRRDLDSAFERLSRAYHALRDDVDRSDTRDAQLDLKPVTEAYLDVEREMGGYPANDRYARERDRRSYER
jgi:hypothetical protein